MTTESIGIMKMENETNQTDDLRHGTCLHCKKKQEVIGSGGLWFDRDVWACDACRLAHKMRSYPTFCEWCSFHDVIWHQGHTYDCPRCNALKIGKYLADQAFGAAMKKENVLTHGDRIDQAIESLRALESLRNNLRMLANESSTYIEHHGSNTSPDIAEMSEDRTTVRLKKDHAWNGSHNFRQVLGHDMKARFNKGYENCDISYVVCKSDEVPTGVEMALLIFDLDFASRRFSLNFKKVPLAAIVKGNTCFANNENCSIKIVRDVSSWKGIVGNGEVQFIFSIDFTDEEQLTVHSKSVEASMSEPFVSELF